MTLLLLVRHGHTDVAGKVLTGQTRGVHLTDRGREQARALAERLESVPVHALYSSPLERRRETAAPLARARGLTVLVRRDLIEPDFGEWTGRSIRQLARTKQWRSVQLSPSSFRFPGGESLRGVQSRSVDAVRAIAADHLRQTVVVVTHADVVRLVLADLADSTSTFQRLSVEPGSISAVALEDGFRPHPEDERHGRPHVARAVAPTTPRREGAEMSPSSWPVERITAGAVGAGQRTFYLQARAVEGLYSVVVEKQQVELLAASILDILERVGEETGQGPAEPDMELEEPLEPLWRVGKLSIGYAEDRPAPARTRGARPRFRGRGRDAGRSPTWRGRSPRPSGWATREQMLALSRHAVAVAARGRPRCPFCDNPMDPEGHTCPAMNGHGRPGAA